MLTVLCDFLGCKTAELDIAFLIDSSGDVDEINLSLLWLCMPSIIKLLYFASI